MAYGVGSLWYGALATAAATFVGHYPVRYSNFSVTVLLTPLMLVVVCDIQHTHRNPPAASNISPQTASPGFHRIRGIRSFGHGLKFSSCPQNLPPGQRDAHWVSRCCQGCDKSGRRNGFVREGTQDANHCEWLSESYVQRPVEAFPRFVGALQHGSVWSWALTLLFAFFYML
jgi:hypothetical protein